MSAGRRGMAVPIVLVVIVLILLMGVSVIFMARHQLSFTARDVQHVKLDRLARSGAELARAQVEFFVEQVPYEGELRTPFYGLLDEQGNFAVEEKTVIAESDNLDLLLAKAGGEVSLEVAISVTDIVRLHHEPSSDLERDETTFMIRIESTARSEGAEATAACAVEGRRIFTHLPPVSKFTLFLRQQGNFKVNTILDSRSPPVITVNPIILNNGAVSGEGLSPDELAEFLQSQGFIYLGGGAPWDFNLSTVGSDPALCDTGIVRRLFRYPLPGGSTLKSRSFEYFAFPQGMFMESRMAEGSYFLSLFSEYNINFSSNLNLFGTPSAPSPTVVFGCAYRWFVLEQGLIHSTRGVRSALPFLTPFNFKYLVWPGDCNVEVARLIADDLFDNEYDRYYGRMSQPVIQDYNAGLPSFADTGDETICVPDTDLPFLPRTRSNDVEIDPAALHLAGQKLTLVGEDGSAVYRGHPENFDLVEMLKKKVCYRYRTAESFLQARRKDNTVTVRGIEWIAGDLAISRPFTCAPGTAGILLVDGDITISAPVKKANGRLYLVSAGGDIIIDAAQPIEAYLAAPHGTVAFPDSFQVLGGVMCRQLDNDRMPKTRGQCRIRYDKALDITDQDVINSGYRAVLQERWTYYK